MSKSKSVSVSYKALRINFLVVVLVVMGVFVYINRININEMKVTDIEAYVALSNADKNLQTQMNEFVKEHSKLEKRVTHNGSRINQVTKNIFEHAWKSDPTTGATMYRFYEKTGNQNIWKQTLDTLQERINRLDKNISAYNEYLKSITNTSRNRLDW